MANKMKAMKYCMLQLQLAAVFFSIFVSFSCAEEHVIANSIWSIPPNDNYYDNWAKNQSFAVGDTLVFRFELGFYNVVKVSGGEFERCNAENPFQEFLASPASVNLDKEGMHYFICSFANYCLLGQKIGINVQNPLPAPGSPSGTVIPPVMPPM